VSDLARVLPLAGGVNFRDLGGYRTTDGRWLRRGRLFRSGVLSYLTPEDQESLQRLGVKVICDLRRPEERRREPTAWPHPVELIEWADEPQEGVRRGLDWAGITSADSARARMLALYQAMPSWLESRVRILIEQLAQGNAPLLFHCSAGKDRTGFCAAVVLHCLGVPRETVLADYELTDRAVDLEALIRRHYTATLGLTDPEHPLLAVAHETLRPVMRADRDYLQAALLEIETRHGTIEAYVGEQLQVPSATIEALRDALLTDEAITFP
jgi:protein-tyrosine phosphatase